MFEISQLSDEEFEKHSIDYSILACDCADSLGDNELALVYSNKLCKLDPSSAKGYWRHARASIKLCNHGEAARISDVGFSKCEPNFYLYLFGSKAYRLMGNHSKSCEYAMLIIHNYPGKWQGYVFAAEDMGKMGNNVTAIQCLQEGLIKFPSNQRILKLAYALYASLGNREKCIEIAKSIAELNPSDWSWFSKIIINLVILNRNREARELLAEASKMFEVESKSSLFHKLDRFLECEDLKSQVKNTIMLTRNRLHELFEHSPSDLPLPDLLNHSDYILIANNSSLEFCEATCEAIKAMKNPLFVYLNIGNPKFCATRYKFFHSNCTEFLYGRSQHIASVNGELFFKPYDLQRFIGCFLLQEDVIPPWLETFSDINGCSNMFVASAINKLIQSCYPETYFIREEGSRRRRVPSMGWFAVTLFEALATFRSSQIPSNNQADCLDNINVWTAGFTLSPSYIFETDSGDLHDHVFERAALDFRSANNLTKCLGKTDGNAKELHENESVGKFTLWTNNSPR